MKIAVCNCCKDVNVEGVICHHCDTSYCYECLDLNIPGMLRLCSSCGQFLCEECYQGMVRCDLKTVNQSKTKRNIL